MNNSRRKNLAVCFTIVSLIFHGCGGENGDRSDFLPGITFSITDEGKGQADIREKMGDTVGEVTTCTVVSILSEDLTASAVFARVEIYKGGADKGYTFDLKDILRDPSKRITSYKAIVAGESVTIPPKVTMPIQATEAPIIPCSGSKMGIIEVITFTFE